MRKTTTWSLVALGLLLMVIGFFGSAPWGATSVADSNPRFEFAPTVFVLGVVFVFTAAIFYELLPTRRK